MPTEREPHTVGRHTLGPHCVGKRVVIRRQVPGETGPTGGPALTDILGEMLSWGKEVEVRHQSGTVVSIPRDLIVSGKPVPPRPSIIHRFSIAEAEAHTARLWPDSEVTHLGEWSLRSNTASERKRANSCLAIGDPGCSVAQAVQSVQQHYRALGRTPLIQTPADDALNAELAAAGHLELAAGAAFFAGSLAKVRRALEAPALADELGIDAGGTRVHVTHPPTGAHGCAVLTGDDWLGIHELFTPPDARERGIATAVLDELLEFGAEQGVRVVWLHVETSNTQVAQWYARLGFETHHVMRYWQLESGRDPAK